ncbi:MAG: alpha/beta hydrolase fold protein [Myxococcales bacterium]|nr:alpha/beta hydrolase fold protein [Myxococcales bacterium]
MGWPVNETPRRENGYGVRVKTSGKLSGLDGRDGEPFSLGEGDRGALLLHGFTGSPFEMRLLGEDLARRGFAVEGVRLAGHVGTTRDLASTTWHDWYRSACEGLDRLRNRVGRKRVAVAGLSMGGLLTLEMARQRADDLAAICVMSAPLWLPPQAEGFARFTSRLPLIRRAALPKIAGSDIRDPEMKRRNGRAQGRAGMPLAALASLVELGAHLRDKLGDVKTPTLLAHSLSDHTVPFECMDAIAHRIGTTEYAKLVLRDSFHVITLDLERDKVFAAVADWFGRYI